MVTDDGGPAFAALAVSPLGDVYEQSGMTLRDYFAGQALAGILANDDEMSHPTLEAAQRSIAQLSYGYADAMLEARK
jgi:hypothetical protein